MDERDVFLVVLTSLFVAPALTDETRPFDLYGPRRRDRPVHSIWTLIDVTRPFELDAHRCDPSIRIGRSSICDPSIRVGRSSPTTRPIYSIWTLTGITKPSIRFGRQPLAEASSQSDPSIRFGRLSLYSFGRPRPTA